MDDAADVEDLRVAVYRALASTGRVPAVETLADTLGWTPDDVRSGLRTPARGAARRAASGTGRR